jgi:isochorismate hydrolase
VKKRYSAFFGTRLDVLLSTLEAKTLVLAGINSHACVRTTAIDAFQRDHDIILATDCLGSYDQEHHDVSMKYLAARMSRVMSNERIGELLSGAPAG